MVQVVDTIDLGQQSEEGLKNDVVLQASLQFFDKIRPFWDSKLQMQFTMRGSMKKIWSSNLMKAFFMDKAFNVRKSFEPILSMNSPKKSRLL